MYLMVVVVMMDTTHQLYLYIQNRKLTSKSRVQLSSYHIGRNDLHHLTRLNKSLYFFSPSVHIQLFFSHIHFFFLYIPIVFFFSNNCQTFFSTNQLTSFIFLLIFFNLQMSINYLCFSPPKMRLLVCFFFFVYSLVYFRIKNFFLSFFLSPTSSS